MRTISYLPPAALQKLHDFSIPQDCVRAMGKTWHSKCFGCEICGLNFSIAQCGFHENEGRALCESCYANNILPKCQACQKPITDRTMKAMGGQWHVSCFVCKVGFLWYHRILRITYKTEALFLFKGIFRRFNPQAKWKCQFGQLHWIWLCMSVWPSKRHWQKILFGLFCGF